MRALLMGTVVLAFAAVSLAPRTSIAGDNVVSGFSRTMSADDVVSGFSRTMSARDAGAGEARASLKDADGDTVGEVTLRETPHGVLLDVQLRSAPSGTRAFHIHEFGACEAPSFESAGEHFAPGDTEHGILNEQGPHAGDLPNLQIPQGGRLAVELFVPDVTLSPGPRSLLDGNGSAVVLHASADDYRSDPAGEAGDRIACGVIERSGAEAEARQ